MGRIIALTYSSLVKKMQGGIQHFMSCLGPYLTDISGLVILLSDRKGYGLSHWLHLQQGRAIVNSAVRKRTIWLDRDVKKLLT